MDPNPESVKAENPIPDPDLEWNHNTSNLRCERCGVPYCCEDHLRSHGSKTREDYCLPFRIRHKAEVSRPEIVLSCF